MPPDTDLPRALEPGDVRLIEALHGGFPLVDRPFAEVAARLGVSESLLIGRLRTLRDRRALRIVVSSRHPASFARAVDGVHLTARDLAAAPERPRVRWVGASCHAGTALATADALGCDFAVLGPVRPTASHPGATGIGFDGLAREIAATPVPVYALGGVGDDDLAAAEAAGAHGVASMRAAWR